MNTTHRRIVLGSLILLAGVGFALGPTDTGLAVLSFIVLIGAALLILASGKSE